MTEHDFIEKYLNGVISLHPEKRTTPSETELDTAEKEFDQLVASNQATCRTLPLVLKWAAAAAIVVAVVILATWRTNMPQSTPSKVASTTQTEATENTTRRNREDNTLKPPTQHVVSNHDKSSTFIFDRTNEESGKTLMKEMTVCDEQGSDIWRQKTTRVKDSDKKGEHFLPQDAYVTLANDDMEYGWNQMIIKDIIERDNTFGYGIFNSPELTGSHMEGRWFSSYDFVLERMGDLSKE